MGQQLSSTGKLGSLKHKDLALHVSVTVCALPMGCGLYSAFSLPYAMAPFGRFFFLATPFSNGSFLPTSSCTRLSDLALSRASTDMSLPLYCRFVPFSKTPPPLQTRLPPLSILIAHTLWQAVSLNSILNFSSNIDPLHHI
ncbi:hypothetical protein XENTR_v10018760 [Xenopus tropicalis]|nr:hypothetical protein XENTR_v10018760 [Xenopus tropicalis]